MKNQNIFFTSNSDEWSTPQNFFKELNNEFNFTLDPCSSDENFKCSNHFTIKEDGLSKSWKNQTVFCNPPYSNVKEWIKKAFFEQKSVGGDIVLLVPARTDTKWFHEYVYKKPNVEIRFLKGRLKFGNSRNSAPFPSMLIIFRRNKE